MVFVFDVQRRRLFSQTAGAAERVVAGGGTSRVGCGVVLMAKVGTLLPIERGTEIEDIFERCTLHTCQKVPFGGPEAELTATKLLYASFMSVPLRL